MKLQTQVSLKKAKKQIDYQSRLLLLGSCFVENIGAKLEYFKFRTMQNPFGILFHPKAIEKLISKVIKGEVYSVDDIFHQNERWHCFDAHSDLSDPSKENLLLNLNNALAQTKEQLSVATHVLITLGTAWVYRYKESDTIVANCHKIPQKSFSKELLSVTEIAESLRRTIDLIQSENPKIQCVFTISPVRHLKDGFVENQRSKAHLIAAMHEVLEDSKLTAEISYFESYELVMDELRDYRFYKNDMVHPNDLAVEYIWEKFSSVWISENAKNTMASVEEIRKGQQHRPFYPESEQHRKFVESLERKIKKVRQNHPFIDFTV
ncbi:GSCFA domain-containing protein [Maribacter sp. TH_r10]|uniref:GSCFA domain-containing protein n=1 Tax=Maribacter sp. TH_r10 TaxID=3082086 RepID=UPI002954C5D3|nr:GSCFA domain-containing protein [Maribacter sp. TH_r10]MDV7138266.1 GSCFA domain-containing protein [Maribacter sp. TH_r10]